MNCAYCEERLSDYLEHSLSAEDSQAMDLHFQSCRDCSELLAGVRDVIQWGKAYEVPPVSPWLPAKIVANTPRVIRITWIDWVRQAWRGIAEPRFAMALLTSTLFFGWLGNATGITAADLALVRQPTAVYYGVEGWAQRIYGDAIRSIYSSSIVNSIQCQIHTRIEQFRENS